MNNIDEPTNKKFYATKIEERDKRAEIINRNYNKDTTYADGCHDNNPYLGGKYNKHSTIKNSENSNQKPYNLESIMEKFYIIETRFENYKDFGYDSPFHFFYSLINKDLYLVFGKSRIHCQCVDFRRSNSMLFVIPTDINEPLIQENTHIEYTENGNVFRFPMYNASPIRDSYKNIVIFDEEQIKSILI